MSSDVRPFQAIPGESVRYDNALTAHPAVPLEYDWESVVLYNNSASAEVAYRVTQYLDAGDVPTGDEPTIATDMAVPPLSQIRVFVGVGLKVIRTIASAANGQIKITPGRGI